MKLGVDISVFDWGIVPLICSIKPVLKKDEGDPHAHHVFRFKNLKEFNFFNEKYMQIMPKINEYPLQYAQ